MHQPKPGTKVLFWILLGFLSTFFAEVLSGSQPTFLFQGFGYYGIFPIYALHSLLLAALVISRDKPFSLRTLYFTSLLFGMYEAYITKVLWEPSWNAEAFKIANVAVVETLLLVLFWHAVISFIIPLFWAEGLVSSSHHLTSILPKKWRTRLICFRGSVLVGVLGGIMVGNVLNSVSEALLVTLVDCLIISMMIALWKWFTRKRDYDLRDLLPRKVGLVILIILLVADYLTFGLGLRREVHPGVVGQIAVLALYTVFTMLIILSIRKDRHMSDELDLQPESDPGNLNFKHWLVFCVCLVAAAALVNFIPADFQSLLAGIVMITCVGLGIFFLIASVVSLIKKTPAAL